VLFWLVDNALLWYLLLGCVLLAVLAYWWMTRRRPFLIAAGIVAGLIFFVWLLTRLVVTDRGQIEQKLRQMADALGEQKPAEVVKFLASDFHFGSITKQSVGPYLEREVRRAGVEEVRIREISITELSRSDRRAEVEFLALVFSRIQEGGYPCACKATFVLEGDDWRLQRLRVWPGIGYGGQEFSP
jgi:hypothetical protein